MSVQMSTALLGHNQWKTAEVTLWLIVVDIQDSETNKDCCFTKRTAEGAVAFAAVQSFLNYK